MMPNRTTVPERTVAPNIAKTIATIVAVLFVDLWWPARAAADCPCGPTYCKDTPAFTSALVAKKAALSKEYPARLVSILDRVAHCEACISTGPDGFSLFRVGNDNLISIDGWDADNERIGATAVTSGDLKQCFVIYVRHAFSCCGDVTFGQRSDYNSQLDLNTDMAVPCSAM